MRKALLVVRAWNRLVEASPDLGLKPLVWENRRQRVSRDWEDFPPAFREAIERYRRERLKPPLASSGSAPACKPATVETHIAGYRRAASVLLDTGFPAEQLTGIAVLCAPGAFELWTEAYYQQLGPDRCDGLFNIIASLRAWARHTGQIDTDQHGVMSQTLQRLGPRKPGLTAKNRARLRPFADPAVQRAWLHLGETLLAKADQERNPKKRALLLQGALMHELLLIAPLRLGNVCSLNLDRHLRWEGKGRRRRVVLILPAGEVKNEIDLEFELPRRVVALLDRYLAEARPRLCAEPTSRFLWPGAKDGQEDGHKGEVGVRNQLERNVQREMGVEIHPHLYRHLAAFFFLKAHPGAFETLRQLLGHKDLATTMAYYVEIDRLWVSRQWGQTLEVLRNESRSDGRRR